MTKKSLVLLLVLGTMWGTSYLIIKVALDTISPLALVTLRILSATVVVVVLATLTTKINLRPLRSRVFCLALLASSFASYVVPYLLISYGETRTGASLAGMLNSTTPIFTAVMTPLFYRGATPNRWVWSGVLIGLVGAVVVFHPWSSSLGRSSLTSEVAILGASLCYGLGILIQKRYLLGLGVGVMQIVAMQLAVASVVMLGLGGGTLWHLGDVSKVDLGLVIALGVFNTGLSGYLLLRLNAVSSATISSSVTYVISVVSIAEGAIFLGESLDVSFILGAVITFGGVVVLGYGRQLYERGSLYYRRVSLGHKGA